MCFLVDVSLELEWDNFQDLPVHISQDSRVKAMHSNRGTGELLQAQLRERLSLSP